MIRGIPGHEMSHTITMEEYYRRQKEKEKQGQEKIVPHQSSRQK